MKPSEFVNKMFVDNSCLNYIKNDIDNLNLIKKQLDKIFIDKEELKEKIKEKINEIYESKSNYYSSEWMDFANIAETEILELLEK